MSPCWMWMASPHVSRCQVASLAGCGRDGEGLWPRAAGGVGQGLDGRGGMTLGKTIGKYGKTKGKP